MKIIGKISTWRKSLRTFAQGCTTKHNNTSHPIDEGTNEPHKMHNIPLSMTIFKISVLFMLKLKSNKHIKEIISD